MRADELLGDRVELGGRDARLQLLLEQRERVGDDGTGTRHRVDLGGGLADDHADHAPSALEISPHTSSIVRLGVQRHELAGRAVVLDDRLGLGVVDGEPPRDHLGRVVGAALDLGAAQEPLGRRRRRAGRGRGSRRARGRSTPSISSSASACARLRGKPSRTKPSAASGCAEALAISATVISSGTSCARARIGSTRWPSSVPAAIAARNMSPVETCGMLVLGRDPLRLRSLAGALRAENQQVHSQEPFVGAHHHLTTPSGASCRARRRRRSAPRCRRVRATCSARSRTG